MACWKLVKAYMHDASQLPPTVHTVLAKHLPRIVNEYYRRQNGQTMPPHLALLIKSLAMEIELPAPAIRTGGQRQDNCEYPWSNPAGTRVFVPSEHDFTNLALLSKPPGRLLLKVLPVAIDALVSGG